MMRITVSLELGQKVSSTLSILFVLLLSTLVALFALKAAREIIDLAQNSPVYHIEKRVGGSDIDVSK